MYIAGVTTGMNSFGEDNRCVEYVVPDNRKEYDDVDTNETIDDDDTTKTK